MEKVELAISAELEGGCLSAGPTMLLNSEDVRAMSFDKETIFTIGATVATAMHLDGDMQKIIVFDFVFHSTFRYKVLFLNGKTNASSP